MVMTGTSVARNAWRNRMRPPDMPRARAKRMKSLRRTSSISARTRRMIIAIWKTAIVSVGITSAFKPLTVSSPVVQTPRSTVAPRPNEGSQPRLTLNIQISRIPMKNDGSEIPRSDRNNAARLTKPALSTAA